jgi:tripeptide aminopeptidase
MMRDPTFGCGSFDVGAAAAALAVVLLGAAAPGAAQQPAPCDARTNPHCDGVGALAERADVRRAFEVIERTDELTIEQLITLTEIPAPPFMEEERARAYAQMLRETGADSVWIDEEGNVLALRRGTVRDRTVAMAGHLDTVFPEGTDVTVRMRGDTLYAPGIGDDTRGLAVVLAVLRAMVETELRTEADVLFIGTVGEEGLGDLRGVKHLFRDGGPRIDSFIAVDGGGDAGITHQALGSVRYRVTFRGPGGHSWGAFGLGNPSHALGSAIRAFDVAAAEFVRSADARTSYNVGRIGGGTSVNSIPFEAWMEVDMRSEGAAELRGIDAVFTASMHRALDEYNATLRRGLLELELEQVGDRPSGEMADDAPIVLRAKAVTRHFGRTPRLGRSSTDANVPIALGVPALTIGRGGVGGNTHSPDEWWLNVDGHIAIQRALLLLVAEAGLR